MRKFAARPNERRDARRASAAPSHVDIRSSQLRPAPSTASRNSVISRASSVVVERLILAAAGPPHHPAMFQSALSPITPCAGSSPHLSAYHVGYASEVALHIDQSSTSSSRLYRLEQIPISCFTSPTVR